MVPDVQRGRDLDEAIEDDDGVATKEVAYLGFAVEPLRGRDSIDQAKSTNGWSGRP